MMRYAARGAFTLNDHRCVEPSSRKSWPVALSSRAFAAGYFARPQDLWMLILGGRTDARVAQLRSDFGDHTAFETIYSESDDPWDSVNPRFSYQRRKYDTVMSLLPANRRFGRALDLGCGLGALSCLLAERADSVLGLDVAQTAVDHARKRHATRSNLSFERGDILDLSKGLNGQFDILMIADTLYYLPSTSDVSLDAVVGKIADLLAPDGICVLTNHLFAFGWDEATRLSRRIHRAFCRSQRFRLISKHWRPFFLTTLLAASTKLPLA
jgi:2-polyprenyl-3-methyl-5-hydroxy-6-metoxy-1,4-benzoquinol methylase